MGKGRLAATLLAAVALGAVVLARPLAPAGLGSHPGPVPSYERATALVAAMRAADGPAISGECGTRLYTHGHRTARAVVLLHGLTNCPAQFDSLARMLHARGVNVLVPRLPHHGLADRMTAELARTEARELCAITDRALDLAHGLGDTVTVAGLSVGGVLAAWAGQERADVARAVVLVPIFGVARAPGAWTPLVTRLALTLPNAFVWWDDRQRERLAGPRHVYPRFATRAVAATLLVGGRVTHAAARRAPAARSLALVTVGGDEAADNALAARVARDWRAHGARGVTTYEFARGLHLSHDLVDPEQVGGNVAVSYPVLLRLIDP